MEGVRIRNKLKLLFSQIVESGYVMNNYYADGVINKISNCSDPGNGTKFIYKCTNHDY